MTKAKETKEKTIEAWAVFSKDRNRIATMDGMARGFMLISKDKNFWDKEELSDWAEIVPCKITLNQ